MKKVPLLVASLLLVGCNSYVDKISLKELKKLTGIDSKKSLDASFATKDFDKEIFARSKDSITFKDGTYITKNSKGIVRLPKGYKFINSSNSYILASRDDGKFILISKKAKKVVAAKKLPFPIVSAKILGKKIFYISLNNIFGIYDIDLKRNIVSAKVGKAYAVDTRITNPLLIKNLLVVPTLDGKLLVINPKNPTGASGLAIGKSFNLNNVIFLGKIGNTIVAATPSKLISAKPGSMNKYQAPIADVTIYKNRVYLLRRDGRLVILSPSLKVIRAKKFDFNRFQTIGVVGGSIFAVDGEGYLLVSNLSLSKKKIYDIGEVDSYSFISGYNLYKDDKVINLNKLKF